MGNEFYFEKKMRLKKRRIRVVHFQGPIAALMSRPATWLARAYRGRGPKPTVEMRVFPQMACNGHFTINSRTRPGSTSTTKDSAIEPHILSRGGGDSNPAVGYIISVLHYPCPIALSWCGERGKKDLVATTVRRERLDVYYLANL